MTGIDDLSLGVADDLLPAERAILGAAIESTRGAEGVLDLVRPKHFHAPAHQIIAEAVARLAEAGDPVSPVTVLAELTRTAEIGRMGGAPYLHTLMAVAESWATGKHAERIRGDYTRRRGVMLAAQIQQLALDPGFDPETGPDAARQFLEAAFDEPSARGPARSGDLFDDAMRRLEDPQSQAGMIQPPWTDLRDLIPVFRPGQLITVGARPGVGKALALDTPLPTPTGWTTMGDVQVGDYLIGQDGRPTRVTAATDVMHGHLCYEVEFSDGSVIVADAEHQWLTDTRASLKSAHAARTHYNRTQNQRTFAAVRTTAEIAATLLCAGSGRRLNHSVVTAQPIDLPAADLPVEPYTLGAWLGDGTSNGAEFTTTDQEILDEIRKDGYEVRAKNSPMHYLITNNPERQRRLEAAVGMVLRGLPIMRASAHTGISHNAIGEMAGNRATGWSWKATPDGPAWPRFQRLPALMRDLGVLNNKHIPDRYLRASEEQRRALLAGLLDTDGYCAKSGLVQFSVTNERLARDTYHLVATLGYKASLSRKTARLYGKDCGTAWTVSFTPSDKVFRLTRKLARQVSATRATADRRYITDVRPVPSVPVRCVQVDSADHLYLAGPTCIPTHNSMIAGDLLRHVGLRLRLPSILFALEMSDAEVTDRMVSAETTVPLSRIQAATLDDRDWDRMLRARNLFAEGAFVIDDQPGITVSHIRSRLRGMARTAPARLAIVDYLQLMTSAGTPESREREVAGIMKALKAMAREFEIPLVLLAQLNRGPESRHDKRPVKADLRESGAIENDSDIVILIHRPDTSEPECARAGEADLIVDKNRAGPLGTRTALFQGHYGRFIDMAREEHWTPSAVVDDGRAA